MKKIILLFALLGIGLSASAGTNGGLGGAFTRVGAGARAKALGNAFTGLADGPAAIYFNAGELSFQQRPQFIATTSRMALDRRLDYLAFSAPIHPKAGAEKRVVNGGVGLGWLHAGVGDIDARDFDGNPLDKISQSSNLFLFSFGLQFHERFGAGLTAKVIYETFGRIGNDNRSVNGDGFGVDFGAFAKPMDHLTVGAQLKDVGSQTTWNTSDYWSQGASKTDKWPVQYRLGAAYERSGLTGLLDLENSAENDLKLHAGVEGALDITDKQSVAGRVGIDGDAPTFGLGLGFAVWKLKSVLDFTYVLEPIAPDNSLVVSWGLKF
jgi:hypothetical protein